jgi:hypothetical protein
MTYKADAYPGLLQQVRKGRQLPIRSYTVKG